MGLNQADKQGILEIMGRLYQEIAGLEEQYSIRFGGGDFRARIEYFHDAVRALSAGDAPGRLSVELLAYDVASLRYIQAHPAAPVVPEKKLSARAVSHEKGLMATEPKIDRAVKGRLGELYQQYAVLFAAVFKPLADEDYHDRVERLNALVEELSSLLAGVKAGHASLESVYHIADPELRATLMQLLRTGKKKDAEQTLKAACDRADARISALSSAHLQYGSSQLGIYEEGKDVVKKLAGKGMNLAGRFVEQSMKDAGRDFGRGRS